MIDLWKVNPMCTEADSHGLCTWPGGCGDTHFENKTDERLGMCQCRENSAMRKDYYHGNV